MKPALWIRSTKGIRLGGPTSSRTSQMPRKTVFMESTDVAPATLDPRVR